MDNKESISEEPIGSVIIQFISGEGEEVGVQLDLPKNATINQMEDILNHLLEVNCTKIYNFSLIIKF